MGPCVSGNRQVKKKHIGVRGLYALPILIDKALIYGLKARLTRTSKFLILVTLDGRHLNVKLGSRNIQKADDKICLQILKKKVLSKL